MVKDLNQSLYVEDEIDLKEIFKILIESKKLLISTILIFTIASIIYSLSLKPSFLTSTQLEIGYVELDNGDRKLIESTSDLISDLKIQIMKNPDNIFRQNLSMNSIEKKIIRLQTTSSSAEQNENFLTDIINYIDQRHSKLTLLNTERKRGAILHQIDLIESEISFIKDGIIQRNNSEQFDLEVKILKLENELPILDQEIGQLEQAVIDDLNNLSLLKGATLSVERAASSPTLEQIVSSYKSKINGLKRERNNSISDISNLSQKLDVLKQSTLLSDDLFKLDQTLKNTRHELQMLMRQTQIKTHAIGNIETITIESKTLLIVSLGVIIGFITSIFLVFINNFIKSYRENEA